MEKLGVIVVIVEGIEGGGYIGEFIIMVLVL